MHRSELAGFLLRVLIVTGVILLLLLLWHVRYALLLIFMAILVSVPLGYGCSVIERGTGLSRGWALMIVGLALGIVIVALSLLVGTQVQGQVAELLNRLPDAVRSLQERLDLQRLSPVDGQTNGVFIELAGHAIALGAVIVDGLAAILIIFIGGFFLAANPDVYRSGLVMLFPPRLHAVTDDAIRSTGQALRLWLLAQMLAMTIVGTSVGLGTWLIGLPAPLALGIVAAIGEFIPYIGPVIGAIPAMLLAINEGGSTIWWTLGLFVAIQQIESNLIMPLVGEHMMHIPPAVLLFAVVAVGLVFGFAGVLVAAPLTIVAFVLIKKLYIRRILGEETSVPGEEEAPL